MDNCNICKLQDNPIYEDDLIRAVLHKKPSAPGHIIVFPRKHYTIFEQVPDIEVARIFSVANKISTAVFESLQMHGTNILVNNGLAAGQQDNHFVVHIIPRTEGDGLKLEWKPKQLSEEEMSTVELMLKPVAEVMQEPPVEPKKEEKKEPEKLGDENNYLIRQLRRIP
ncbi:MAG: HIT family protein [Candidatus Woesearchaeota archaeon]